MKTLEHFLRSTQRQLFKRLCKKFNGKTLICKGNFILVRGKAPVMLVAHLDTVHDEPVRDICTSADGNILMSPQGIGGDDRCGCFALVKIFCAAQVKPWLLFTTDEEIGGVGAKAFCTAHKQHKLPNEIDELKFIIELDDTIDKVVDIIGDSPNLPRFEYIEKLQNIEPSKIIYRNDTFRLPRRIPADFRDIYEYLLDFYSVNELESFREEFGDHIL